MKILSEKSRNRKQHTICSNNKPQRKSASEILSVMDNRASHITQKKGIEEMKKKSEISNHPICQFVKNSDGREIPAKLYHVTTSKNWELIKKSGLGFASGKLWLSSTKSAAVSGTASVLLKIDTTDIPRDKIKWIKDIDQLYSDDKVWVYYGVLEKSKLTVVH